MSRGVGAGPNSSDTPNRLGPAAAPETRQVRAVEFPGADGTCAAAPERERTVKKGAATVHMLHRCSPPECG
jgi:hypothetical protein